MPTVQYWSLNNGLNGMHTDADKLFITSTEATTFTEATSTYALGNFVYGVGNAVGAPSPGSPNGSVVTVAAITAGSLTTGGAATTWAIVDSLNENLLATGTLAATIDVLGGNLFTLASFTIQLPDQ